MIDKDIQLTDIEKLYILTKVCYLEAIDSLCGFHFQVLNKDYSHRCIVGSINLYDDQVQKLLDLTLKETKGRAMIMSDSVTVQAYDFEDIKADTLKEAIVKFLVKNWFLRIDDKWAFSFKFREKVREVLLEH